MSLSKKISVKTGPVPWNENDEEISIGPNGEKEEAKKSQCAARKRVCVKGKKKKKEGHSAPLSRGARDATHDATGTVPIAPSIERNQNDEDLRRDYKELREKYKAMYREWKRFKKSQKGKAPMMSISKVTCKKNEQNRNAK